MIIRYLAEDRTLSVAVVIGILIRYLPQVYFEVANRKRRIVLKGPSVTKASYIFCLYVVIVAAFLLRFGSYANSTFFVLIGISLFSIGIVIGMIGLFSLNYQYCEELVRYDGARLVTHGIYGIVRHPMRIGLFVELLGIVILTKLPFLFIPLIGVLALQFVRTRDEESMLKEYFGKAEVKYISSVPRFNFVYGIIRVICGWARRRRL